MDQPRVTRLDYEDELLRSIACPRRGLRLTRGLGSGLTHDAQGRLWALGDRGPNLKVKLAVETYGLERLATQTDKAAKVMPALEIGPAIAELRLTGDRVEVVRQLPLAGGDGKPLSGLPTPGSANSRREPALDLEGRPLSPDPGGADSEGIAVAPDGSFWIGDEYGPSLLHVRADGRVLMRWVPKGEAHTVVGAGFAIADVLPAIAAKRHVNRGFEALALSSDGSRLTLAFQSPLAHPDEEAHAQGRHVRIMALDTETGVLTGQWAYPLEEPTQFRRDIAKGKLSRSDLKVSELTTLDERRLLVLERGSETTKIFVVELTPETALPPEHAQVETRPTLEELSAASDFALPMLAKRLVFDTDQHPDVSADLEGMTLLDDRTLLLVNDNDFGIEDAATAFWRVEFAEPL
jgi:hypothetical protein